MKITNEITYDESTHMFTVWDETYTHVVATTAYHCVAEAALDAYNKLILGVEEANFG